MKNSLSTYSIGSLVEMLQGSKKDSEAGFTEIYNRYSSRVFAYCLKILGDKEQAEDIFQEVFFRFYQNARKEFSAGSVIGYLITVARNLCLNIKRDQKSTVHVEDYEHLIQEYQSYEDSEIQELIKVSIDLLDNEYKEPLILKVYDEMNYKEIGKICGITESNARSRVCRAKKSLRNILAPYLKEYIK
jgi:RNA polymerase sigma-70 factor (ECF subfamily)